jgi:hypothetical protein
LLDAAIRPLRRLIELGVCAARLRLGLLLVRLTETLGLLLQATHIATQRVDDGVELRVEVVAIPL